MLDMIIMLLQNNWNYKFQATVNHAKKQTIKLRNKKLGLLLKSTTAHTLILNHIHFKKELNKTLTNE